MKTKTLAECLLRRKELQDRLLGLSAIKDKDIYEVVIDRRKAHEGVDDIIAKVPKLEFNQVVAEYNHCSSQLRKIDAIIQRMNWTVEVMDADDLFKDYK